MDSEQGPIFYILFSSQFDGVHWCRRTGGEDLLPQVVLQVRAIPFGAGAEVLWRPKGCKLTWGYTFYSLVSSNKNRVSWATCGRFLSHTISCYLVRWAERGGAEAPRRCPSPPQRAEAAGTGAESWRPGGWRRLRALARRWR